MSTTIAALAYEIACDPENVGCEPLRIAECFNCQCRRIAELMLSGLSRAQAEDRAMDEQIRITDEDRADSEEETNHAHR